MDSSWDATVGDARKLLLQTKVKELESVASHQLVQLLDTDTVERALQVLADNRILSAPVIAPGEEDGQTHPLAWPAQLANTDIMGFVCVNDILTSFLEYYAVEAEAEAGVPCVSDGGGGGGAGCDGRGGSNGGGGGGMLARMRLLERLGRRFAQQQLRHLSCKGCDGDFLHSRHAGGATLLELVYYGFLDPKRRGMHEGEQQAGVVHRVALFDAAGAISSLISQSDIVRFLADHLTHLGALAGATMGQLGWDRKRVVGVTPETPALDAMRLMVEQGVSSLAVVAAPAAAAGTGVAAAGVAAAGVAAAAAAGRLAPAGPAAAEACGAGVGGSGGVGGRLLGNFSASEMRTMTSEHFGSLALPVGEFLALEHDTEYVAANRELLLEAGVVGSPAHEFIRDRLRRQRPTGPGEAVGQRLVVAGRDTTFGEVVGLLVRHRIHRVYVVDEHDVPVGIVTCTDVLRKVVEVATQAAPPSPASSAATAAAGSTGNATGHGHPAAAAAAARCPASAAAAAAAERAAA